MFEVGKKYARLRSDRIYNCLFSHYVAGGNWGTFDFVEIIRNLDSEFKDEITTANRQPGFYSVKDDIRVEYRSLPNFVSQINPTTLINRIRKCL